MTTTTVGGTTEPRVPGAGAAAELTSFLGGVVGLLTAVAGLALNVLSLNALSKSPQITASAFWPTVQVVVVYFVATNCLFLVAMSAALLVYRNKLRQYVRVVRVKDRLEADVSSAQRLNKDISQERMVIAYVHTEFCAQLRRRLQRNDGNGVMDELGLYLGQILKAP